MSEKRKKYDREFREGAVRIVEETKKPIARVARDLGVSEGTHWAAGWPGLEKPGKGTEGLSRGDIEEPKRLRARRTPSCGRSVRS
jgi:transposase